MSRIQIKAFSNDKEEMKGFIREEFHVICVRRKMLGLDPEGKTNPVCKKILELDKKVKTKLVEAGEPGLLNENQVPSDIFGIALSGGGIRSATFNLGLLKALNDKGIFKYADYLSTVSGGGYLGGFVQDYLKHIHNYKCLFSQKEINRLKGYGDYLEPGKGWRKIFERLNFYINTIILFLLHSLWFFLFFAFLFVSLIYIGAWLPNIPASITRILIGGFLFFLIWYYFFHPLRHVDLWSSKKLFYAFSTLAILISVSLYSKIEPKMICNCLESIDMTMYFGFVLLMIITGFFANPNILSAHRFYRFRLKDAFLEKDNTKLHSLLEEGEDGKWTFAPYPLINTTLNLQADEKIPGMKSCDYFLLSPLYCGSKITGYISTETSEYSRMTLATAMTISGAAVNPSMGYKSNRLLSFFMTLLNLRLGYWALNPRIFNLSPSKSSSMRLRISAGIRKSAVWTAEKYNYALTLWPYYNIAELFGAMHSRRIRINLSDGGNIENLAVFELLRRRCKLIIVSDVSADPNYSFSDLKNLLIRARNELELSIEFSDDQNPEKTIRPNPKTGQSLKHYSIARIYELSKDDEEKRCIGLFVYVKASVTPQRKKLSAKDLENRFYSYMNYHTDFPHESTIDQFFDEKQWEAYEALGEKIGGDLFEGFSTQKENISVSRLVDYFESQLREQESLGQKEKRGK